MITVVAIKSLKTRISKYDKTILITFFTILKAILRACNSAVNILALPASLTWALRLLHVAAAATPSVYIALRSE